MAQGDEWQVQRRRAGDELGTTPMGYLRDRRLERAREELVDTVPQALGRITFGYSP